MGLVKRAADLAYTFRFIRMLVMDWKNWDAYKEGLIDENGNRIKTVKMDTEAKKSSYTPFIRLAANTKRLLSKIPGGSTKLGSFAAGLFLIKEHTGMSEKQLSKFREAHKKSGVVYLGRIPPFMGFQKVRHLLEQYGEIGRVYLAPEDNAVSNPYLYLTLSLSLSHIPIILITQITHTTLKTLR